jgi:hypothetical protein
MKIFVCWSGGRGQALAKALKRWLVGAVPALREEDVFLSHDIAKGRDWFGEVRARLREVDAAVICLTPESVGSTWMHFEAGVVLGQVGAERVFPYLLKVRPEELPLPLGAFQATVNGEEDTRRLAETLCRLAGAGLPADYGEHWARLRGEMELLRAVRLSEVLPGFAGLFRRKTFTEPLEECTDQTWADRYAGARETKKVLEQWGAEVSRVCEPRQVELFSDLVGKVDGYARLVKGKLVTERQFYEEAGTVDFTRTSDGSPYPEGASISATAERRRGQIRELVSRLDTPGADASEG